MLALYLVLFGIGAAVASRLVGRTTRPDRWFLGIQFFVGVTARAGVLALVELPKLLGVCGPFESHFAIDGYNVGGYRFDSPRKILRIGFVHLGGPLLIMAHPCRPWERLSLSPSGLCRSKWTPWAGEPGCC